MIARELTAYERRILNQNRICPVCGEEILDFEDFKMLKVRHRHRVYYNFIHKRCEHGEERLIWPIGRECKENN